MADGICEILFLDYGNTDKVWPGEIVAAVKDIPEGEALDKCVDMGPSQIFKDSGKEARVEKQNIVLCGADIPAGEEVFEGSAEAEKETRSDPKIGIQENHNHQTTPTTAVGGEAITCRVCDVFNPGNFYLQEKEKDSQLNELLEKLDQVYCEKAEELRLPGSLIREGQLCVVMWPVDCHFYRASIVEAQDSLQFKMEYYDYGTFCLHTRDQLYTLMPDLRPCTYPKMCQKARLHGVKRVDPLQWGRQASETFQSMVGGGLVGRDVDVTTRVVSRDSDCWSVTLEVEEEESGGMLDVAERLSSLGLVLLEFTDPKPVKKLEDSDSNLLLALEKLSSILQQRKVSLEPVVARDGAITGV